MDLVVLAPNNEKLPMDMLMELKDKIRESNIPILVEIFDWARLPESFHKNIEASHEVLYRSSGLNILHEPETEYNKKKPEENS